MVRKIVVYFLWAAAIFLTTHAYAGKSELATYYPSPAGEYDELKTNHKLILPVKPVDTTTLVPTGLTPGEIWVYGACPSGNLNLTTGVCA